MVENNKDFTCYYIGQKYDKVMPGDGALFELGGDNGFINIGFTNMTDEEIAAIHNGKLWWRAYVYILAVLVVPLFVLVVTSMD